MERGETKGTYFVHDMPEWLSISRFQKPNRVFREMFRHAEYVLFGELTVVALFCRLGFQIWPLSPHAKSFWTLQRNVRHVPCLFRAASSVVSLLFCFCAGTSAFTGRGRARRREMQPKEKNINGQVAIWANETAYYDSLFSRRVVPFP